MTIPWEAVGSWPVRALVAGGAVLLAGRLLLALTRQPARRVWVGTAAVVAALLAIPLALVPGWLKVSVPGDVVTTRHAGTPPDPVVGPESGRDPDVAALPGRVPAPASAGTPIEAPRAQDLDGPRPDRGTPVVAAGPVAPPVDPAWDWRALVAGGYGLLAAGFLVRLAMGHLALARLWRKAHAGPPWAEAVFRRLAGPVRPRAELRVSARPVGPVCFGVLRPRVLVPAGLLAAGDGPAVRAIFAHEVAHLGRRDPLTGWLLGLARAAYFACPWLAGLRREVRVAQECLADAAAARQAAGPADYAELLIRMARSRPAPLGAAGARGPSSELYRRVTMLLRTPGGVEGRCPRRWGLAVGGGLTALAVLAAGLSVRPRPAAAAEPDKAAPVKKEADKKEAPKGDPLKDALDKLKKDLKDDPAAVKQLDDLLKEAQKPADPGAGTKVPPRPGFNPRPLLPRVAPGVDVLDGDKEIELAQELLRQQLEMLQKIQGAVGARGGAFVLGPDGFRPLTAGGGVRLGVRVERPNDVLASQLDLPPGQGLVCVDVPADSVAGKAGIKPHDVLLEVGGKPVSSNFPEFQKVLADVKPDTPVDIVVMRKGKKETIKGVKLPEAKPLADFPGIADFPAIPAFPNEALLPLVPGVDAARPGAKAGVAVGPGETARVEQVNDAFTVFYAKNGVKVTIAGTKEGGVPKAESIEVDDNGKTTKAESIDKLPKAYQDMAKNALKAVK